ncbi:Beta-taxilin [Liparis tanakae]|uniref:Beta-taxilin n=1 Tax=Liparis tanakae TaxID=230148 RepID=A0A4Z2EA16_9TELE|nr:Beta-taxilin [Liparis tanakae]
MFALQDERQQLQRESRSGAAARRALEALCRELQAHCGALREEGLRRRQEDAAQRADVSGHFQSMLSDIQQQIEQHSTRNDRLCLENSSLTDKLEGLMAQCESREERELQQQLTEARLQQARALLSDAEDKHRREKEYLLREAIDKTKKCFAMKEQELTMKKKLLVQAAEWKLQTQSLRGQGSVMQEQLSLYAQKFDEFQGTLAKSNEIYVRFKKEMDNVGYEGLRV